MRQTFYTYKNSKVVLVQANRFYVVKNQEDLDKVVDSLIQYDAVSHPADISFPCIMELESEFAPSLRVVSEQDVIQALKDNQDLQSTLMRDLKALKD